MEEEKNSVTVSRCSNSFGEDCYSGFVVEKSYVFYIPRSNDPTFRPTFHLKFEFMNEHVSNGVCQLIYDSLKFQPICQQPAFHPI